MYLILGGGEVVVVGCYVVVGMLGDVYLNFVGFFGGGMIVVIVW